MRLTRAISARATPLLLGVTAMIVVAACSPGDNDHEHMKTTTTSGSTITIKSYSYTVPKSVRPEQKITVRNEDSVAHTVTSKAGQGFDSKVGANATSTFTAPTKPGSYPFICTYHPYMKATLVVK